MAFWIDSIIIHNRAPFEHIEIKLNKNEIALLNAYNGGGKTTILSHIADAFYELAKPFYENEFYGKQDKLYRISTNIFSLDTNQTSFVYIRFIYLDDNDTQQIIDYIDVRNKPSLDEYNNYIKLEDKISYYDVINNLKESPFAKLFSKNVNRKLVNTIFQNNLITYFPAYRFEYPGYMNDIHKEDLKFNLDLAYSGYLPNPIENINRFSDIANWIMDVILDWQINKTTQNIFNKDGRVVTLDTTFEKTHVFDKLNDIIDLCLHKNTEDLKLRLGIGKRLNPNQRISIMSRTPKGDIVKYPSIFNLSSGEMEILNIFCELIHQADNINLTNKINGIVLIDEIDNHLHIKLQKEVIPKLMKYFPDIQFIISSHSPFINLGLTESCNERLTSFFLNKNKCDLIRLDENPLYDEVYQMMLNENENYKSKYEELVKNSKKTNQLLVEDKYDQIYKIAWLKLMDISFTINDLEEKFNENSPFEIINDFSASGIAGCMSVKNPNIFHDKIIIGLFDYDKEGSEKFYNLKEGFIKEDFKGDIEQGIYKSKSNFDGGKMYALLLPVPQRLHFLIGRAKNSNLWKGNANFANYVEIETLIRNEYLEKSTNFEIDNVFGYDYYKAKDDKKNVLWKELIEMPKEAFLDFIPLFKRIYELFEIEEFME